MATVGIQARTMKNGRRSYALWYKEPDTGKQRHYKTFRMKKVADEEAHKLRILLDTGSIPPEHLRKKKGVATFDRLAEKLQLEWQDKLKTQELSQVSVDGYLVHLKMIGKTFAGRMLGSITKEDVLSYRVQVAEETSNVTSNRRLFILKQVFSKAKEEGLINRDDVCELRYLSEKRHERTMWLNPEQLVELLEAAAAARSRHYMPLAILLAAEHGASKQEILNLRWEDIDFDLGDCGCISFFGRKRGQPGAPLGHDADSKYIVGPTGISCEMPENRCAGCGWLRGGSSGRKQD